MNSTATATDQPGQKDDARMKGLEEDTKNALAAPTFLLRYTRLVKIQEKYGDIVEIRSLNPTILPGWVGFIKATSTAVFAAATFYTLDFAATVLLGNWKGRLIFLAAAAYPAVELPPGLSKRWRLYRLGFIYITSPYLYSFGGMNFGLAMSSFLDNLIWRFYLYPFIQGGDGDSVLLLLRDCWMVILLLLVASVLPAPIEGSDWPLPRRVVPEANWKVFAIPSISTILCLPAVTLVTWIHGFLCHLSKFVAPHFTHSIRISFQKSLQWISLEHHRALSYFKTRHRASLSYVEIDPSKDEVRLLMLMPRTASSVIECTLIPQSLNNITDFEAISYRWSNDSSMPIQIGEQRRFIPKTLYSLLRSLQQDSKKPRMLWIDSLCINQADTEEKSWQIKLMGRIYSSASRVVAWMGDSPSSSGCLQYLSELSVDLKRDSRSVIRERFVLSESLSTFNEKWAAVRSLFQNEWFSRVWIIQEVVLAKDVVLRHGSEELALEAFDHVISATLSNSELGVLLLTKGGKHFGPGNPEVSKLGALKMMQRLRQSFQDSPGIPGIYLGQIMRLAAGFRATEPHDRIYGLLGLSTEEARQIVGVNYAENIRDVMLRAARYTILREPVGLQALSVCGRVSIGNSCKEFNALGLPSWCPDWLTPPEKKAAFDGRYRKTTLHIPPLIAPVKNDPERLVFRGCDFDIIVTCTQPTRLLSQDLTWKKLIKLHDEILGFVDSGIDLCSSVSRTTYDLEPDELFWRTALTDVADFGEAALTTEAVQDFIKEFHDFRRDFRSISPQNRPESEAAKDNARAVSALMRNLGAFMFGKRFALTRSGRTALLPAAAELGDHVCLIFGAETPFVVRPSSGNDIQPGRPNCFIGSCYVHGITNGELENREDIVLEAQDLLFE